MLRISQWVRARVDPRARDAIWALRTRGDLSVTTVLLRDQLGWTYPQGSNREHLAATMAWLCAAQEAAVDGGVASFYDVRGGYWGPVYPETTGYLIPTFYEYAEHSGGSEFRARAERMADWLLTLQLDGGAFPIGPLWPEWERTPLVFDTGQIIQGLVRAYTETGRGEYLAAAQRAADWLAAIQDADGCWRKFTPVSHANTYNARTAWAMLQVHQVGGQPDHQAAALRHLRWALAQQQRDGWFANAGFTPEEDPLTHTIAYTIEGLLQAGLLLGDETFVDGARRAADAVREQQTEAGYLPGRLGPAWRPSVRWSCLTGTAQMAMIWLQLYALNGNAGYQLAACSANQYVMRSQNTRARLSGVRGGIAGSHPIYGDYEPYRLLNWAAKFFVDSLLLDEQRLKAPAEPVLAEIGQ